MAHAIHLARDEETGKPLGAIEMVPEAIDVIELMRGLKHEFGPEWRQVNDEIETNGKLTLKGKLPGKDR